MARGMVVLVTQNISQSEWLLIDAIESLLSTETFVIKHRGITTEFWPYLENQKISCLVLNPTVIYQPHMHFGRTPDLDSFLLAVKQFYIKVKAGNPSMRLFILLPKKYYDDAHLMKLLEDCGCTGISLDSVVFDCFNEDDLEALLNSICSTLYPHTCNRPPRARLHSEVIRSTFERSKKTRSLIENFRSVVANNANGISWDVRATWASETSGLLRSVVPIIPRLPC